MVRLEEKFSQKKKLIPVQRNLIASVNAAHCQNIAGREVFHGIEFERFSIPHTKCALSDAIYRLFNTEYPIRKATQCVVHTSRIGRVMSH